MAMIVADPISEQDIRDRRAATGADRYDEVWDGVYIVMPWPNPQHQKIVSRFSWVLENVVDQDRLGIAYPGLNVTDRREDWVSNYRCLDAVVLLNDTRARIIDAFCLGGPDFVVEILSPYDRARDKFDFYAAIGVREILLIDRTPWAVELHRLEGEAFRMVGRATVENASILPSGVLPLTFGLVPGDDRPTIEAVHADGRRWAI